MICVRGRQIASVIVFSIACVSAGVRDACTQPIDSPVRANASDARITIHANQGQTRISPEIYGQFAEHLGGCVYGGLWVGPESEIPNINGYREDVLESLKKLRVSVLRWPGGCYADDYHWRDGIGPREKRPRTINIHWGNVEDDNSFGTHEFLNLCELLGCEAYVAGNVGSGTVEEMREWVEYMTSGSNSSMAQLRRQNGRDKPWSVRYFGVGNENWGCGGNMTAAFYSDLYKQYATFVRDYGDNRIVKIACGPGGDDAAWLQTVADQVGRQMDAVSMHYYVLPTGDWNRKGRAYGFEESEWFSIIRKTYQVRDLIEKYEAILDEADPRKRIGLYVDEWGTWYDPVGDESPSALYQQNTIRDAVSASIFLNTFHDHCGRIRMSNIAQVVNVLQAMILTRGDQMLLTPTYHVFEMYNVHQGATLLPSELQSEEYTFEQQSVSAITGTASKDADGVVHVSVTNVSPRKLVEVECILDGMTPTSVSGRLLTGDAIDARNTFEEPHSVMPRGLQQIQLSGNRVRVSLPAKSIAVLAIRP